MRLLTFNHLKASVAQVPSLWLGTSFDKAAIHDSEARPAKVPLLFRRTTGFLISEMI
jgi:hypothetical protein